MQLSGSRIGLHHIPDAKSRHRTEYRERDPEPFAPTTTDAMSQIIHRSAALLSARIGATVFHTEQGLRIFRRHTDKPRDPHPKQRTGTTAADRRSNTRDIPNSNRPRHRSRQSLIMRNVTDRQTAFLSPDKCEPQGMAQYPELQPAQDRK